MEIMEKAPKPESGNTVTDLNISPIPNIEKTSVKTKMVRNPFKKEDSGCSFIIFILIGLIIQLIFFSIFIDRAYLRDHTLTLDEMALKRGFESLDEIPYGDPLLDRD
jgi:hypothetical protein